ncbi:Signal transduction histidine kinase, contains PAS domain [Halalkaliarchaeum sp. AArc-CO]|uniref:GAF domain-containing sensor histidine kinase n=1 Tax=unclassified Halalkaliarchaeum TaxID=2678344 RepID=UPI00217D7C2D|nr:MULTISPECIES: ATP-binding protein [unclassified Halalkaliarchaeum]MDR5674268.1 ATP-binding protein [Halalkaliarchaeum sp. AArc-GB]UWG51964.1 Signal transduction histidine kinase, contains PAS domain [Halalkaliarchaeum sp. AArc-CO]
MTDRRDEGDGTFDRNAAYSQLYEVMQSEASLNTRLEAALEVGASAFDVEMSYIAEIDREAGDWEIVLTNSPSERPDPIGLQEDLENTFCSRTIEEETTIAFADVADVGLEDHPAAVEYGISCYHGAPILVDGKTYGTVCFSSQDPRAKPFTEAEKSFTHLLAQMIGHEIEQADYDRELAERERELNEREEIYRALIDASFDFVFRLDLDGRFVHEVGGRAVHDTQSIDAFLGYGDEGLDGTPITVAHPNQETTDWAWSLFDRVLNGETVEARYFPLETNSGEIVYVDLRGAPIYDGDVPPEERSPEDIVGVQGTARDATERKRRDGLISVINRILRHNLRNDVGVIDGYAELLESNVNDGENAALAGRIRTAADRLLDLSETAQKLEENVDAPPELRPVDVVPVLDRVVEQIDATYPDAEITVSGPESAVTESAPRMETALWELVDNAAKHTGESPAIDVDVAIEGTGEADSSATVVITVADDGPGLPEMERSVLEAGEEEPLVHGQGLGLWLVYWIVTSLEGDVSVADSRRGTTIQVRLPAAEGSAESSGPTSGESS